MENSKGKIENLLDGLEEQSKYLTKEEIKRELEDSGVDTGKLIANAISLRNRMKKRGVEYLPDDIVDKTLRDLNRDS